MMGNYWRYMYGYGGPGTLLGWIIMILFLLFVIWAIVSFIRWIARQDEPDDMHDTRYYPPRTETRTDRIMPDTARSSALDILEERYARGELSRQEFEDKKRDITRR